MGLSDDVRSHFASSRFGPPCQECEIHRAESALGMTLPENFRELYLAFNGSLGPTDARFFWPLFAQGGSSTGLVDRNLFLRGDDFPQDLVSGCIFFGDDGCGPFWATKINLPGKVIRWDAEWGDDIEVVRETPLDAWLESKRLYENVDEQARD